MFILTQLPKMHGAGKVKVLLSCMETNGTQFCVCAIFSESYRAKLGAISQ